MRQSIEQRLAALEERQFQHDAAIAARVRIALATNHPNKAAILAWLAATPNRRAWAQKHGIEVNP